MSELGPRIVVHENTRKHGDVAAAIEARFAEDGIELAPDARVAAVAGASGAGVTVRLDDGRSFAGSPMFTHVPLDDYRVAKSGIIGGTRTTAGRVVPSCVFIEPEFARVGLSETEARRAGVAYRLAKIPMDAVPRARTLRERQGFMKALVAADDDRILGFAMLGAQAGEVMATVQAAMLGGLPFTALRDGILAHPTLAEGLNLLFATVSAAKGLPVSEPFQDASPCRQSVARSAERR